MRVKPPLGVTPAEIHRQLRIQDLLEALLRYNKDTKYEVGDEWIHELNRLWNCQREFHEVDTQSEN